MIYAICNAYNEAKTIERAIESVYDHVDKFILMDGAYKGFKHDKPGSTDGMIEIAKGYDKVNIVAQNGAWNNQCDKRTNMFRGKEGDYYIKIDGDEELVNAEELENLKWDFDIGWAWTLSNLYSEPYMTARIFKHIEGMRYAGRHHWLFDSKKNLITSDQNMGAGYVHYDFPLRFYNMRQTRTPERNGQKTNLVRWRTENNYRNENSVYNQHSTYEPHANRAGKPRKPSEIIKPNESTPDYSMTSMISREWAVDKYFDMIEKLFIPESTEFVCLVDGRAALANSVRERLNKIEKMKFNGIKMYVTGDDRPEEMGKVAIRRARIIRNWQILLTEVQGEILLGTEDDTLAPPDAYMKLLEHLEGDIDFAQGTEISRWGSPLYPAWHIEDDEEGKPCKVRTSEYRESGIQEIRGVGWYCFVMKTELMRKVKLKNDELLPLGPDLHMGYDLFKMGYKLIHDWSIKCEHFGEDFSLIPGKTKNIVRSWERGEGIWKAS